MMNTLKKKKTKLKKLIKTCNKKIKKAEEEIKKIKLQKIKLDLISKIPIEYGNHIEEVDYYYCKDQEGYNDERFCEIDVYEIKFDCDIIMIRIGRLYENEIDSGEEIFGEINGCSCWDYVNNQLRFQKKDRRKIFAKILKGLDIPRTNKNYKRILKICQELIHTKSKILSKNDKLIFI